MISFMQLINKYALYIIKQGAYLNRICSHGSALYVIFDQCMCINPTHTKGTGASNAFRAIVRQANMCIWCRLQRAKGL